MWVLIDNYDSFTYILHDYLLQAAPGVDCPVYRNDEITIDKLKELSPQRIIISPGPETPLQAGITIKLIEEFHTSTPILGICLGHQALGMYFGGELVHAPYPMHGKTSEMTHTGHSLFKDIASPFTAMRYHSLSVEKLEGTELEPLAWSTDDSTIMALVHKRFPCVGIQFHPESIGTDEGLHILRNWKEMY
jgi:anthranilate synthase/aminodeoxychorismate synthase-like glutamine amidotransferase